MTHPCDRRAPALFHNLSFCEFDRSEPEIGVRLEVELVKKTAFLNKFDNRIIRLWLWLDTQPSVLAQPAIRKYLYEVLPLSIQTGRGPAED
jgi:hypothetical protein